MTKQDMTVARQGTLSPFGMLTQLFSEELVRRNGQGIGTYRPMQLAYLEENADEGQPTPPEIHFDLDVNLLVNRILRERQDKDKQEKKTPEQRILERVILREKEIRTAYQETRRVVIEGGGRRITASLPVKTQPQATQRQTEEIRSLGQETRQAGEERGTKRTDAPRRSAGLAQLLPVVANVDRKPTERTLTLASRAMSVPASGGWTPKQRELHPGYPAQANETKSAGTPAGSILLPDVLRRRRETALARQEAPTAYAAETPDSFDLEEALAWTAEGIERTPETDRVLREVRHAVWETLRRNENRGAAPQEQTHFERRAAAQEPSEAPAGTAPQNTEAQELKRTPQTGRLEETLSQTSLSGEKALQHFAPDEPLHRENTAAQTEPLRWENAARAEHVPDAGRLETLWTDEQPRGVHPQGFETERIAVGSERLPDGAGTHADGGSITHAVTPSAEELSGAASPTELVYLDDSGEVSQPDAERSARSVRPQGADDRTDAAVLQPRARAEAEPEAAGTTAAHAGTELSRSISLQQAGQEFEASRAPGAIPSPEESAAELSEPAIAAELIYRNEAGGDSSRTSDRVGNPAQEQREAQRQPETGAGLLLSETKKEHIVSERAADAAREETARRTPTAGQAEESAALATGGTQDAREASMAVPAMQSPRAETTIETPDAVETAMQAAVPTEDIEETATPTELVYLTEEEKAPSAEHAAQAAPRAEQTAAEHAEPGTVAPSAESGQADARMRRNAAEPTAAESISDAAEKTAEKQAVSPTAPMKYGTEKTPPEALPATEQTLQAVTPAELIYREETGETEQTSARDASPEQRRQEMPRTDAAPHAKADGQSAAPSVLQMSIPNGTADAAERPAFSETEPYETALQTALPSETIQEPIAPTELAYREDGAQIAREALEHTDIPAQAWERQTPPTAQKPRTEAGSEQIAAERKEKRAATEHGESVRQEKPDAPGKAAETLHSEAAREEESNRQAGSKPTEKTEHAALTETEPYEADLQTALPSETIQDTIAPTELAYREDGAQTTRETLEHTDIPAQARERLTPPTAQKPHTEAGSERVAAERERERAVTERGISAQWEKPEHAAQALVLAETAAKPSTPAELIYLERAEETKKATQGRTPLQHREQKTAAAEQTEKAVPKSAAHSETRTGSGPSPAQASEHTAAQSAEPNVQEPATENRTQQTEPAIPSALPVEAAPELSAEAELIYLEGTGETVRQGMERGEAPPQPQGRQTTSARVERGTAQENRAHSAQTPQGEHRQGTQPVSRTDASEGTLPQTEAPVESTLLTALPDQTASEPSTGAELVYRENPEDASAQAAPQTARAQSAFPDAAKAGNAGKSAARSADAQRGREKGSAPAHTVGPVARDIRMTAERTGAPHSAAKARTTSLAKRGSEPVRGVSLTHPAAGMPAAAIPVPETMGAPERAELVFAAPPYGAETAPGETASRPKEKAAQENGVERLPTWAQELLEQSGVTDTAQQLSGFTGALGTAPSAKRINWTAPGAVPASQNQTTSGPAQIAFKERREAENTPYRTQISDAELQRTADKVYRLIEERLRRELRRSGH
ncbi:MAG: hypothetical protein E7425_13760 [Ruminococcaceae bacterium]|nr:hypothetical protein [Oscillospiraceae bacterium]